MGQLGVILLDTHVVIWLALEPAKISEKAQIALQETRRAGEGLAISDITLLEIAITQAKGRIRLNVGLETFLAEIEAKFVILPITGRTCVAATQLPKSYPKDPADRILAGTALAQGIALVTADKNIRQSKAINTIW